MKTLPEKIKDARSALGLSQEELGQQIGVSRRSVIAYETGQKKPRDATVYKLAMALHVSIQYLKDENCDEPTEGIEKDGYVVEISKTYGASGANKLNAMLSENAALFAGGDLSQEQKDAYFEALTKIYTESREIAREKFGRKK
mgnify:CR=1 FL=1